MLKTVRLAGALLAVLSATSPAVLAQTAPVQNPLMEAARVAWDALPADDRKAIQNDLVWASTYNGTLDGTFGRGTFEAVMAFELKARLKADGIVEPAERTTLATEAGKLRTSTGYQVVADPKTGIRLGLPLKAVDATAPRGRGTAWTRKDGRLTVFTEAYKAGEADLGAMFEERKADQPGRKVTYSVLRPGWFVVAGETQTHKFYARYASGASGVVGYTYGYEKTVPDGDRMAVIIANSFDPFPGAAPAAPPAAVAVTTIPIGPDGRPLPAGSSAVAGAPPAIAPEKPAAPATPTPPAQATPAEPKPVPPEKQPNLAASGLVVAPNRVLTVAVAAENCRTLTVRGKPAKVARADAKAGLALLEVETGPAAPVALRQADPAPSDPLVVLGQSERAPVGLMVAAGDTIGTPSGERAGFRVLTPVQPGGLGGTVVDRTGAVAALIHGVAREPRRVAGVVPEAAWEVVGSTGIAAFLGVSGVPVTAAAAGQPRTAGQIALALKAAVVPIACAR